MGNVHSFRWCKAFKTNRTVACWVGGSVRVTNRFIRIMFDHEHLRRRLTETQRATPGKERLGSAAEEMLMKSEDKTVRRYRMGARPGHSGFTQELPPLLTFPPPGTCLRLSLEPQRDCTLLKSNFFSRICTWRVCLWGETNGYLWRNSERGGGRHRRGNQCSIQRWNQEPPDIPLTNTCIRNTED